MLSALFRMYTVPIQEILISNVCCVCLCVLTAGCSVPRGGKSVDDLECVTDETLSQYSVQDMVIPLPGYDVIYPKNDGQNLKLLSHHDDGTYLSILANIYIILCCIVLYSVA